MFFSMIIFEKSNTFNFFGKYYHGNQFYLNKSRHSFNTNLLYMSSKQTEKSDWVKKILIDSKKSSSHIKNFNRIGITALKNIPIPSSNDESWQFTPIPELTNTEISSTSKTIDECDSVIKQYFVHQSSFKLVFINGVFSKNNSDSIKKSNDFFIGKFSELNESKKKTILELIGKGESGLNGGFFSVLNMALINDLTVIILSPGVQIQDPVHIINLLTEDTNLSLINHRLLVYIDNRSMIKIFEHHVGLNNSQYVTNSATDIVVCDNSTVDYMYVNEMSSKGINVSSIHGEIGNNSNFNFTSTITGGLLSRLNVGIDLEGVYSSCYVKGGAILNTTQISDMHSRISHNFPNSKSSQLQKNLISERARAIFAGKIQVHYGAPDTQSDQLCRTLLLSPFSRIDVMPILEINNENVKCTHGSTVSDVDSNQIFYFQSRGISIQQARYLLTLSFIYDIIQNLPIQIINRITSSNNLFRKL